MKSVKTKAKLNKRYNDNSNMKPEVIYLHT